MARYNKKRARELQHDRFRDATMGAMDRLGNRLEGKGRLIIYGIAALLALGVLVGAFTSWRARKADEARRALGRAIEIAQASVTTTPVAGTTDLTFPNQGARSQRAIEEFRKVADKYGDPTREIARYFIAVNLLNTDRGKGIGELEALSKSGDDEIATLSKFAFAEAKEEDGQYDAAAALYGELAKKNSTIIPAETANLRLAAVYEKLGKKQEAADLLFAIADAARKAKDADGKPAPQTSAAREAARKLETLDPARYAQLPPESSPSSLTF